MANRQLLHKSKLDSFRDWLRREGWEIAQGPGGYEVLRAIRPGRRYPLLVYSGASTEHLSLMDRDAGVVKSFIRAEREKSNE